MSNNLNAPVLNVKLIKWSLNRINIIKHCTLIYIILMFLWDNVRDTYQIQLIIANIINPLWTGHHGNRISIGLSFIYFLLTRLILMI